jgi:hypothetical protein
MNPTRALALALAGTVAATLATIVFAAPALASGPPEIFQAACYQTVYSGDVKDGQSRFECYWSVTGGTGTVTATYSGPAGGIHSTSQSGGYTGYDNYRIPCYDGLLTTATIQFTDSTGAQVSNTQTLTCIG